MARTKKQTEIPGTERPVIDELEEIVQPFLKARYQRMALAKEEHDLHSQLLERMKQLKVKTYVTYDDDERGFELRREPGAEKVKARKLEVVSGGGTDPDGEDE